MREIQVVGIVGSPRKGKNTDVLVRQVLEGCRGAGAAVDTVYLGDLDIHPCRACKIQDGKGCLHRDGMDVIYRVLESADLLVLGTPVYYNSVSAQMKLMIDRSYCLARPVTLPSGKRGYRTEVVKPKKGIVVAVGGSGTNPECVLPVFNLWAPEVNLEIVERIAVSRELMGREPMEDEELCTELAAKGAALVQLLRRGS